MFISDLSILDISEYSDHCPMILNIGISRDRQICERVRAESKVRQENSQASLLSTFTKWNDTLDQEVKDCFNSSSFLQLLSVLSTSSECYPDELVYNFNSVLISAIESCVSQC